MLNLLRGGSKIEDAAKLFDTPDDYRDDDHGYQDARFTNHVNNRRSRLTSGISRPLEVIELDMILLCSKPTS